MAPSSSNQALRSHAPPKAGIDSSNSEPRSSASSTGRVLSSSKLPASPGHEARWSFRVGVIGGGVYDLAMRTRSLGASGIDVPVIVFGAWAVGGWGWGGRSAETDRAAVAALRRGLDLGMTAIDTAPVYGFGHSEELVAQAIAGRREEAIVMTKAGLRWDD